MAVNLFGLPEPDDLLGPAQKEAMESARRLAEVTRGIGLAREHQALADRALEMQAAADRALEPIRAAEQARRMMETEFTDLARQVAPPLNIGNDLAEMARQFASPLPDLGGLGGLFHRIPPDFWQESERRMRELAPKAELLGQRGWTIPPRWGVTDFADVVDRISADELDDAWLEYYTAEEGKEFDELIKALGEIRFLDPWRDYLEGAEYLYRSGRFAAAIPGLFAAMDGAFAAAICRSHRKVNLRQAAVEFRKTAPYASREVSWSSLVGFTDVVYGDHKFGEAPPPRVNRHLVQHGRAMPPRPQVDCLRLLQALETLSLVTDRQEAEADPEPASETLV
jgi:hypothetical protein